MLDLSEFSCLLFACLDSDEYRRSLHDIEYIFILGSIWCCFFFLRVAMEIHDIDMVECSEEMPSHPTECRIIEIPMIGDIGEYSFIILLDHRLRETEELHIVVLEPVLAFAKVHTIDILIILDLVRDPLASIGRDATIWRIADDDHDRFISFYFISPDCLFCDTMNKSNIEYILLYFFICFCFF